MYKILEQNGVENENIDGGAFNNFAAGGRDGIIAGVLTECALAATGNSISISSGLLIICGIRVKITSAEVLTISVPPVSPTSYQIIAEVTLQSNGDMAVSFYLRSPAALQQDMLYSQGYGTYQAEIGSFVYNPDGSITNIVRTIDVLYGGSGSGANIEIGTVTTSTLPAGTDAEFDVTVRKPDGTRKTVLDIMACIPQGRDGAPGSDGKDGQNGTTFTPHIDDSGNLSWTNDGDKQNPAAVNIKGAPGLAGEDGEIALTLAVLYPDEVKKGGVYRFASAEFNRTPHTGERFNFFTAANQMGTGEVRSGIEWECVEVVSTKGDTGTPQLFLKSIIDKSPSTITAYWFDYAEFNRTPVVGDICSSTWGHNGKSWLVNGEITELRNGNEARYDITSMVETTGEAGTNGTNGRDGTDGADGTTFTPHVDSSGNLSWTNDGGKQNPATVNIKGEKGDKGADGADGADGAAGANGQDGVDGEIALTLVALYPDEVARGGIYRFTSAEFNRTPHTGERFNFFTAANQMGTGEVRSGIEWECVEVVSTKGDTGTPQLFLKSIIDKSPSTITAYWFDYAEFNRTPVVGDICSSTWGHNGKSWLVNGEITELRNGNEARYDITSMVETTGKTGAAGPDGQDGEKGAAGAGFWETTAEIPTTANGLTINISQTSLTRAPVEGDFLISKAAATVFNVGQVIATAPDSMKVNYFANIAGGYAPDTGNAITVSTPTAGQTYTVPANGWLCVSMQSTANGQYLALKVVDSKGTDVWGAVNLTTSYFTGYPIAFYPVKQGDIVMFDYTVKILRTQFIYATA